MRPGDLLANRASGNVHDGVAIREGSAAGRANDRVLQIRGHVCFHNGGCGILLELERPLLDRTINLTEIVDTGILLRGGAGFDEVGDRDRCEQADDGHYDHDFNQREAGFIGRIDLHTIYYLFSACGVN